MKDDASTLDAAELRKQALYGLRKRRGFRTHLLVFLLVSGFMTLIWAVSDRSDFYWPLWPEAFWGIFVIVNGVNSFRPQTFSEADIQKQMGRMKTS